MRQSTLFLNMKRNRIWIFVLISVVVACTLFFVIPISLLPDTEMIGMMILAYNEEGVPVEITEELDTEQMVAYLETMKLRRIIDTDDKYHATSARYAIDLHFRGAPGTIHLLVGKPDFGDTSIMNTADMTYYSWCWGPFRWRYRIIEPQRLIDKIDALWR